MKRRFFFSLAVLGVLAACGTAVTDPSAGVPLDAYIVNSVVVDSAAVQKVKGRAVQRDAAQIEADVRDTVVAALEPRDVPGGTPIDVGIVLQDIRLSRPEQNVFGGVSKLKALVTFDNARTGQPIQAPQVITGNAEGFRIPVGLLAIATTKTPEKDYQATLAGFAHKVERSIYGNSQ